MEKIQIQFKESDYKVYYGYCLKYYQIHEVIRKQSIHAFLELFEKGFMPVEAQDIQQARQLLSKKCDDLKKEHNDTSSEGDTTMLLQSRICGDLLIFIEDLEKIFRLIQKQGIAANYLMILGTFSKVISEGKSLHLSIKYNLKSEVIESLARPLADIVQMRLGTDRQWRSVLRELAFIAARFNQRSFESKFDLDIIQLVAPAVVSYFNKDVKTREILSELPSYFEECELEEFEAFLNGTPDLLKDDQEADINWDAINEPLKVVAGAVAAQREQWSQGHLKISDPYSLAPPTDIESPDNRLNSGGALSPSFPGLPQTNGYKTFDIAVSPDLTTQVDFPLEVYPISDTASVKPEIQKFVPIIIGVAIILLFIFGSIIVSGDWNLTGAGNTTNSTTGVIKNTTTAKPVATTAKPVATTAQPVATTAKPVATTAKPVATTAQPVATTTPKLYTSAEIGSHLTEIAFGPDNNVIRKPTKNFVTFGYTDSYTDSDIVQLNNFINLFNNYSATIKISTNVNLNSPGDYLIDFLPGALLKQINKDMITASNKNFQTGNYYFVLARQNTNPPSNKMYVNSDLKGDERQRWILRALLYNLGFSGETTKYSDSIFYSGTSNATKLSDIDLKALQLMYGQKITNGMTKSTVTSNS